MKASYDSVALYYDSLARLIYGKSILKAHQFLVDHIPANSSVLVVGGGTGFILEKIAKKYPEGIHITYVDSSAAMLILAKKRNPRKNTVVFLHQSILEVSLLQSFNVVITPFMLDNFSNATVTVVFDRLHNCLAPGGLWLFADFTVEDKYSWWQKPLLKLMYIFFRTACGIEATNLPDISVLFQKTNYRELTSGKFYWKFICATIYKRS